MCIQSESQYFTDRNVTLWQFMWNSYFDLPMASCGRVQLSLSAIWVNSLSFACCFLPSSLRIFSFSHWYDCREKERDWYKHNKPALTSLYTSWTCNLWTILAPQLMCFLQTLSFSLHKMLIDGLEFCGLLVDYCYVYVGTHSLDPLVSKWCNATFPQIYSNEEINSSSSWMARGWVHFQHMFICAWTTLLKYLQRGPGGFWDAVFIFPCDDAAG